MFLEWWRVCFTWFTIILDWSKYVVDLVSLPIAQLVNETVNINPDSIFGVLVDLLLSLVGDLSIFEFAFGVGLPFYLVFVLVKFLVGLAY